MPPWPWLPRSRTTGHTRSHSSRASPPLTVSPCSRSASYRSRCSTRRWWRPSRWERRLTSPLMPYSSSHSRPLGRRHSLLHDDIDTHKACGLGPAMPLAHSLHRIQCSTHSLPPCCLDPTPTTPPCLDPRSRRPPLVETATWNVGGRAPPSLLSLDGWLCRRPTSTSSGKAPSFILASLRLRRHAGSKRSSR
jgi:hypothetical protein